MAAPTGYGDALRLSAHFVLTGAGAFSGLTGCRGVLCTTCLDLLPDARSLLTADSWEKPSPRWGPCPLVGGSSSGAVVAPVRGCGRAGLLGLVCSGLHTVTLAVGPCHLPALPSRGAVAFLGPLCFRVTGSGLPILHGSPPWPSLGRLGDSTSSQCGFSRSTCPGPPSLPCGGTWVAQHILCPQGVRATAEDTGPDAG